MRAKKTEFPSCIGEGIQIYCDKHPMFTVLLVFK